MKIIKAPNQLNRILLAYRKRGKRIGFVPTMGFLHEGHLSLVRRARKEKDVLVVSIFVNPLQFGPREDFKRYPRNLSRDKQLLKREHVDFLFLPPRRSLFPKNFRDFINPGPINRYLCGPKRPGHFRGVATVVNRLFQIIEPHVAYFGAKDYQQARIVEDMVRRLGLAVRIKKCPIVREKDGLAMSSRNYYLSRKERIAARAIYQSLIQARHLVHSGITHASRIKKATRDFLTTYTTKIDYVEIVDPKSCHPVKKIKPPILIAIACFIGSTRLIDNLLIKR